MGPAFAVENGNNSLFSYIHSYLKSMSLLYSAKCLQNGNKLRKIKSCIENEYKSIHRVFNYKMLFLTDRENGVVCETNGILSEIRGKKTTFSLKY